MNTQMKQWIIVLIICAIGYFRSSAQNIEVSGITNPAAANGIYEPNGTLFGYDSWKHESQEFYIYNDDYGGRFWNIDDDTDDNNGILFYSTGVSTEASPIDVPAWSTWGTTTTPSPTGTPVLSASSAVPEIDIQGNSLSIADGDNTPSTADYTDFGSLDVSSGSLSRTYTIENTGGADLNLTDVSPFVSITGHTSDFSLTTTPSSTISAGGTTTFTITFNPTATGTRTAEISITNNDSDENPYNFTVQGEGYSAPTATTSSATSISTTIATMNGTVNANNSSTTVTFQYGLTTSYGTTVTADESPVTGSSDTPVSYDATGLSPYTTYHFRVVATNSAGTTYGSDHTFTTSAQLTTVTTQAATDIGVTTATGNGTITAMGVPNPTQHGICWNTSGNPTLSDSYTEEGTVSATGAFTSSITGLNPNTLYYVRAYVTNAAGTTYGVVISFTTNPEPATVTTQAVTDINTTTATGNGTITDLGAPNPTQHGVCWSTSENPTTSDTYTEEGAVSATGTYTSGITGLTPNTTYYVRAYAINTAGTSYGDQVSFTTAPALATATTQAATDIGVTTATGNGNITALGAPNPTQHGVCWNTNGNPTLSDSYTEEGAVSATGAFTSSITGLNPNTLYYVRAYVTNAAGTTYGVVLSFTTDPAAATVTTQAVSDIDMTTATGNGTITDLGAPNPTQYGICWSTSENPTIADNYTEEGAVSATGAYTSGITGLTPNTTYYVRAYATNAAGTSYGDQVSFTTDPAPATVTTQAVSSIDMTTATGNGNITDLGTHNPTQHGVCWSTSENPTIADIYTEEGAVSATGAYTSGITGLTPNTTYYVRAYATNTAGTSYGDQVSFTTDPAPATVTTQTVTDIYMTIATGNGNITDLGAPNPTQHGVCWSTNENPTIADNFTEEGAVAATGAYTSAITGLNPNTTYYVRAYATNTAGTSYGDQVSFTTDPQPARVTTMAVTDIDLTSATGNGNIYALGIPAPTQHGVCWSTNENPTIADNFTEEGAVAATGAYTSAITGLNPNTTYYVRAYVTNTAGPSYGSQITFTTMAAAPTVTTQEINGITGTTANLSGLVNANNSSTTVTFEYGLTDSYGLSVTADQSPVSGTADTQVSSEITGLSPNTTYHYRVVGVNDGGTEYGSDLTFTTLSQAPIVTTNEATSIEVNSVVLNGTINANDLSTTAIFEYGLTNSYGTTVTADQSPVTGTTDTDVSATITGLSPNTAYYYRLVGQNSSATTNGEEQTFTTAKYDQEITFNALPDKTTDDEDFVPGATSNLGLEISYTSSNESVATIVDGLIHIVGVGSSEITARQEGNDTINAATPVTQNLTVTQNTDVEDDNLSVVKLYPNPAQEIAIVDVGNINITENVEISIIDLNGKIIFQEIYFNALCSIDVTKYNPGLYFVLIKTSDGANRLKLVIE